MPPDGAHDARSASPRRLGAVRGGEREDPAPQAGVEVSQIHTGIVGAGSGATHGMSILRKGQDLWEIRFADSEQVYHGRTLGAALTKAIEYRMDGDVGPTVWSHVVVTLEALIGVRR